MYKQPADVRAHSGKCVIEIDQAQLGIIGSESATGDEISETAWSLIEKCTNQRGAGGTARLIGNSPQRRCALVMFGI